MTEISFEEIEVATLVTILEQDELTIDSELQLFKAVEHWAEKECARKGWFINNNNIVIYNITFFKLSLSLSLDVYIIYLKILNFFKVSL